MIDQRDDGPWVGIDATGVPSDYLRKAQQATRDELESTLSGLMASGVDLTSVEVVQEGAGSDVLTISIWVMPDDGECTLVQTITQTVRERPSGKMGIEVYAFDAQKAPDLLTEALSNRKR